MLSIKSIISTAALLLIIAAIITLVIIRMIKNKKAGKHSCSCGCGGCAYSGICKGISENADKTH